jgi:hypothetical protein
MMKEAVENMLNDFTELARKILATHGNHDPISIFFTEAGPRIVSSADILDESEEKFAAGNVSAGYAAKDRMAVALREIAEESKAYGVITIVEAWMTRVKSKDLQVLNGDQPGMGGVVGPLPRFDKNREEVLTMAYEFKMGDGSRYDGMIMRPIIRTAGAVSLGDPERYPSAGDGRLTGLIK